jgi:hypothetical protein
MNNAEFLIINSYTQTGTYVDCWLIHNAQYFTKVGNMTSIMPPCILYLPGLHIQSRTIVYKHFLNSIIETTVINNA